MSGSRAGGIAPVLCPLLSPTDLRGCDLDPTFAFRTTPGSSEVALRVFWSFCFFCP